MAQTGARGASALASARADVVAGIPDAAQTADAVRACRDAAAPAVAAGARAAMEADAARPACRVSSAAVAAEMTDALVPLDPAVPPRALPDARWRLVRPGAPTSAEAALPLATVEARQRGVVSPADALPARADARAAASGLAARCEAATWAVRISPAPMASPEVQRASTAVSSPVLRLGSQRQASAQVPRQPEQRPRPVSFQRPPERAQAPRHVAFRRPAAAPARVPRARVALRPAQVAVQAERRSPLARPVARGFPLVDARVPRAAASLPRAYASSPDAAAQAPASPASAAQLSSQQPPSCRRLWQARAFRRTCRRRAARRCADARAARRTSARRPLRACSTRS
jgi:hypothetical protein